LRDTFDYRIDYGLLVGIFLLGAFYLMTQVDTNRSIFLGI